jgi:hypothetical protein
MSEKKKKNYKRRNNDVHSSAFTTVILIRETFTNIRPTIQRCLYVHLIELYSTSFRMDENTMKRWDRGQNYFKIEINSRPIPLNL